MNPPAAVQRPDAGPTSPPRRRRRAPIILGALAVVAMFVDLAIARRAALRRRRSTFQNPTPYELLVEVSNGHGDGWLPLGTVDRHRSTQFGQVYDIGDNWQFRVWAQGERAGRFRRHPVATRAVGMAGRDPPPHRRPPRRAPGSRGSPSPYPAAPHRPRAPRLVRTFRTTIRFTARSRRGQREGRGAPIAATHEKGSGNHGHLPVLHVPAVPFGFRQATLLRPVASPTSHRRP